MFYTITYFLGSTLQGGWAVAECGQVGFVLDQKLGWNATTDDADFFNNLTIVTVMALLGMIFGGYIGGLLLPKFGSRRLIIAANIISLIFNTLKQIESTGTIMTARFAYGVAMGLAAVSLSRTINDTVPAKDAPKYGAFVNAGFGIGIFFSNLMGLLIPINNGEDGDIQKMKDD